MRASSLFVLFLLLAASGCARYQYRVAEPAQGPADIDHKRAGQLEYEPLRYELIAQGPRLAMGVMNPTTNLLTLAANRSYLVDPKGVTHPLEAKAVAPGSRIRLVFPPEPEIYRSGPSFTWGFGAGYHYHPLYPDVMYSYPMMYDSGDFYVDGPDAWEWTTGPVTLRLFYEVEGQTNSYDHRFLIFREKIEKN